MGSGNRLHTCRGGWDIVCPPPGLVGSRVTGWWIGFRNHPVLLWWVLGMRPGVGEGVCCSTCWWERIPKPLRSVGGGPSISHPPRQRGAGPPTHQHPVPLPPSPTHHTSNARAPDPHLDDPVRDSAVRGRCAVRCAQPAGAADGGGGVRSAVCGHVNPPAPVPLVRGAVAAGRLLPGSGLPRWIRMRSCASHHARVSAAML